MKSWLSKKIQDAGIAEKMQSAVAGSKGWISEKVESSEMLDNVQELITEGKEWATEKLDSSDAYAAMQQKLAASIDGAFESVIESKRKSLPTAESAMSTDVDYIIKKCAMENAAIAGGSSLIPGPWGMVAVVPEIALVIRNQISMVYDIGAANGKAAQINKELLAAIVLSAMSNGVAGLMVMHGGKVLIRRSSLRVFKKIVTLLSGKVTQQALKSSISKWLPVVGAAFMAWITNQMTQNIGRRANEIFQKEIEISDVEIAEADVADA
jgi:hypothetical protein